MEESDKYKLMKFSGKRADFSLWKDRFLAHCCVKECDDVVERDGLVPEDAKSLDPTKDLDLIKYRKDNKKAYGILINLVSDPSSVNAVMGAKTTELPKGCVRTAFKNLLAIYDTKNDDIKHEIQQKFNKSELTSNDKNPDIWFSQLETWRLRLKLDYKVTISDAELVNHIIYNLKAKIYETNILIIKREHLKSSSKTKLEDLKDEIRLIFSSYKTTSRSQQSNSSEVSMVAATQSTTKNSKSFPKKFKGDCRLCGTKGHKAADCWDNEKNKDKRPSWYKNKNTESANVSAGQSGENKGHYHCTYCGKNNHNVDRCFKKQKDDKKSQSEVAEVVMVAIENTSLEYNLLSKTDNSGATTLNHHSFIADSGASSHMRFSQDGMTELEPYVVEVKVGNSESIYSTSKGKFQGTVIQRDGSRTNITLKDVLFVPNLWTNLFSITKAINNPAIGLGKTDDNLIQIIPKDRQPITFDKVVPTGKAGGRLLAVDIVPQVEQCAITTCSPTYMHHILNHANSAVVKATAKKMHIKLVGPELTCESCAKAKAKVKRLNKESKAPPAKNLGERVHFDLCTMRHTAYSGIKNWLLIQDEYTKFIWSRFLKLKSDLPQTMIDWLTGEEKKGSMVVSKFRCDNAPEHYSFQTKVKAEVKTHKKFEFTAPNTPEHNGRVERKYATLFGKVRAMLNEALLPAYLRHLLWARAASCASKVENIIVNNEIDKSPHELVYGENPPWVKSLRTFGEIAIIQVGGTTNKIKAKLENRGIPAMFIDYPTDHASDVYVFMKLENRQIVLSRNYIWLNKLYGEYKNIKEINVTKYVDWISDEEDEDVLQPVQNPPVLEAIEEIIEVETVQDEEEELEAISIHDNEEIIDSESENEDIPLRRVSGLQRDLYHLRDEWNPDPERFIRDDNAESANNMIENDVFPRTYREAMKRSDRKEWKKAFWKEFENTENKAVWQFFEKQKLPKGRKVIGNRWVHVI